jgi:polyhydroxyalkanoate synthesis regulator phasin
MLDSIKKTLLTGLGAAVVTKDKVQASLEDLVRQGKLSTEDARAAAERIVKQGKREFEDASGQLHAKVNDLLTHSDRKSQARIDELEARIRALERQPAQTTAAPKAAKAPRRPTKS